MTYQYILLQVQALLAAGVRKAEGGEVLGHGQDPPQVAEKRQGRQVVEQEGDPGGRGGGRR